MIVNKYAGKCQSCAKKLSEGEGFAFNNGVRWIKVCTSTACMSRLGVQPPAPARKELTEDGKIFNPYDPAANNLLKMLPGAHFDVKEKCYVVNMAPENLPRVLDVAQQLGLNIPQSLLDKANSSVAPLRNRLLQKSWQGRKLFQHQVEGAIFLALNKKAILADEMGLGKTITTLAALNGEPVLLICPASLKYNWREEFSRWQPEYKVTILSGRGSFQIPSENEVVIINYNILDNRLISEKKGAGYEHKLSHEEVERLKSVTLVCDESHVFKNSKTQISKKIATLSRLVDRRWLLTGTPLMNRPKDLFGMLQAADIWVLGNWEKFVQRFNGYKGRFGWEFGFPNPDVPFLLRKVMLRRLKSEALDLPPKTYKVLEVDVEKSIKDQLDDLWKDYQEETEGFDFTSLPLPDFEKFSLIRAKMAASRIPDMIEVVESYEESDTPLVVFSAHKAPILALKEREGWRVILGETPSEERQEIVKLFQAGKLKGVALTIKAGGVGLTLTHASNALFVDLDWTPALNVQAEDRISRIGQTNNTLIIHMQSDHPLDQHVQNLLRYKMELAQQAIEKTQVSLKKQGMKQQEIIEETEEELQARLKKNITQASQEQSLDFIKKISDREIAKGKLPQPKLTKERKELLLSALHHMIGRCDGANKKDDVGFNKPDAYVARHLSIVLNNSDDDLTWRVLERILSRYHRQLANYEGIWK